MDSLQEQDTGETAPRDHWRCRVGGAQVRRALPRPLDRVRGTYELCFGWAFVLC